MRLVVGGIGRKDVDILDRRLESELLRRISVPYRYRTVPCGCFLYCETLKLEARKLAGYQLVESLVLLGYA